MCQTPQLLPAGTYTISVTLTNDYVLQSTINSDGLSSNQSLSPPTVSSSIWFALIQSISVLTCPVSQFQINTGVNGGNTMTFNGQQVLADTVNNLVALGGTSQQVWNFVPVNCDNQNPY